MNIKRILREGWFDNVISFFKGDKFDADRLANSWLSEQEVALGIELDANFKEEVRRFVEERFEKFVGIFQDQQNPQKKAARLLVKLLDKRYEVYIESLLDQIEY